MKSPLPLLLSFISLSSAYHFTVKKTGQPPSLAARALPYHQLAVDQTRAKASFDLKCVLYLKTFCQLLMLASSSVHDLIYIANVCRPYLLHSSLTLCNF
jgi:hypothetical protein